MPAAHLVGRFQLQGRPQDGDRLAVLALLGQDLREAVGRALDPWGSPLPSGSPVHPLTPGSGGGHPLGPQTSPLLAIVHAFLSLTGHKARDKATPRSPGNHGGLGPQRETLHLLAHSPRGPQKPELSKPKPGAGSSLRVTHIGGSVPGTWTSPLLHEQELDGNCSCLSSPTLALLQGAKGLTISRGGSPRHQRWGMWQNHARLSGDGPAPGTLWPLGSPDPDCTFLPTQTPRGQRA